MLAIIAFVPLTFCSGYSTAWFTDLHCFRQRSIVERIFWSIPLSIAVSTITAVLIGKFLTLNAVSGFLLVSIAVTLLAIGREFLELRKAGREWNIGWRPLGGTALMLAVLWMAFALFSLVDFEGNQRLFISLTNYDLGQRVNWTESVLRTGIPPANPYFFDQHSANLRYYYFWLVDCAAVAKFSHISARAVLNASCVWSGFALVALLGLYLKHFLAVGERLRKQFLLLIYLLPVTGLYIFVNIWVMFFRHMPPPGYVEVWPKGQLTSWISSFFFYPHHVASLVCCMFAFLLAWKIGNENGQGRTINSILIAFAMASAFGLSVYVAFGFFLVTLIWAFWQAIIERKLRPTLQLSGGGAGACVLLLPYLWELTHSKSKLQGGSVFAFSVRETIPPESLLNSPIFQGFASGHPTTARALANLILMAPGYAIEMGFFLPVLLVWLVPKLRGRTPLTPAHRTLVFFAVATFPFMSLIRSGVLDVNDFGIHCGMFLQFPLLLLASEMLIAWRFEKRKLHTPENSSGMSLSTPTWLRTTANLAFFFGVVSSVYIAIMLRFLLPLSEWRVGSVHDPQAHSLSHKEFISQNGYAKLNASIASNSVVQFNVADSNIFWRNADLAYINHQVAIFTDEPWCGSELGGDPSNCPVMATSIDSLYKHATPLQARATCHQFGIQYLVANMYDQAWNDKQGWVWTLNPVVSNEEFRALDCR